MIEKQSGSGEMGGGGGGRRNVENKYVSHEMQ